MRVLGINDSVCARAKEIVEYAAAHVYVPHSDSVVPGDDPRHVMVIYDGYRVVYSVSRFDDGLYRHLSISVPNGLPSFGAVRKLALLFGFTDGARGPTGFPATWQIGPHRTESVIIVAEAL